MAYIDKIYGTKAEYDEFYAWCEEHYPTALPYFYQSSSAAWNDPHSTLTYPITNFPGHIDRWLLKNCPLPWVVARIKEQYGLDRGPRRHASYHQQSQRIAQQSAARRPRALRGNTGTGGNP